ncbi:MAG: hypothetical protein ACQEWE_16040 [Bacillota bacterium]
MKIEQLYYTSAKRGIGNGSGFQVYSKSEGITQSEVSEIQQLVGYVPPSTLPSRPTEQEVRELFPKSFSYFRLTSGRYGVYQSSYVGKDYSERFGNYFSHVLVFNSVPTQYPIEYYQSSIFKERLTDKEEAGAEPPIPLPPLNNVPVNPRISYSSVTEFLREKSRLDHLYSILSILVTNKMAGRRLMIIDEDEHLPYWYAAIQFSFPKQLALNITFSTYTHNPDKNSAMICSTWSTGTRFTSAPANQHPYYLFDFQKNNIVSVNEESDYARYLTEGWKRGEPTQRLFSLLEQSTLAALSTDLDHAVSVLRIINEGASSVPGEELRSGLRFVNQYGSQKLHENVMNQLSSQWFEEGNWEEELLKLSLEDARTISAFLFRAAQISEVEEHKGSAYTFFIDTLDQLMLDAQLPEEIGGVLEYSKEAFEYSGDSLDFHERIIDSERLSKIDYLRTEPNPAKVEFYFNQLVSAFSKLSEYTPSGTLTAIQHRTVYLLFILMMKTSSNKVEVLKVLHSEKRLFVEILNKYREVIQDKSPQLVTELEEAFQQLSQEMKGTSGWSTHTLKPLARSVYGKKLIMGSFYKELATSQQPVKLLEHYFHDMFRYIPELDNEWEKAVTVVLHKVNKQSEHFYALLSPFFLATISDRDLQKSLEEYVESIVFTNLHDVTLGIFKRFKEISSERKIGLNLNVINLIDFSLKVKEDGRALSEKSKAPLQGNLIKLSQRQHKEYLEWILPEVINPRYKEHERKLIIDIFCVPEQSYLCWNVLSTHPHIPKKAHIDYLLAFILEIFDKRRLDSRQNANIRLETDMIQYFSENKSEFKKVNEIILQHPLYKKGGNVKERWEAIRVRTLVKEKSSPSKGSIFSKIKSKLF